MEGMLTALLALVTVAPNPADRVLVVANSNSPISLAIADHYRSKRSAKKRLVISCADAALDSRNETMAYAEFKAAIEEPLRAALAKDKQIDFIVMTKGVPLRLTDAPSGVSGKQPSLDSFVAALDYPERKDVVPIVLNDSGFTGKCWANRFWDSQERFSHAKFGGYLVTRLDGYTEDEAKYLVSSAIESEKTKPTGRFLIDCTGSHAPGQKALVPLAPIKDGKLDTHVINEMAYGDWDADLQVAGERLAAKGFTVILDTQPEFLGKKGDLIGYASWGSNDGKFVKDNYLGLRFAPGGIAETAVSTSARTFLPTQGGQSLIVDLVRGRASGAKGYCDEPLLQAVASPTVLFDRYTRGWTLAESYYAASRFVGWEDIVIGDPLCAPFAKR